LLPGENVQVGHVVDCIDVLLLPGESQVVRCQQAAEWRQVFEGSRLFSEDLRAETVRSLRIQFFTSLFFYLFAFAINLCHRKFITADVTAVQSTWYSATRTRFW